MINKNIIAMGFVSFFTDMASAMVTTILPIYIVYILNDGVDKLGYVIAIATFVSYAFRFVFGYLSDKYQKVKLFLVIGYFISAVTKPLLYFANSWQSVASLRALERMGKAVRSATKDTLISYYAPKDESGKNFGFHKMMDIGGEVVGALIAFFALFYLGKELYVFKNIFLATLIPGIIAVLVLLFFVDDVPYDKKEKIEINLKDDYKLLPILITYFGIIFFMMNDNFYIIKAKESGISIAYIPLLVVLLNLTQTILSYFIGLKIDKIGAKKILNISFIFALLSLIALFYGFVIVSFILLGVFIVSSLNAIRSYISQNAVNKSSVYGFLYAGVAIFSSLGAIVIGNIWQFYSEKDAFIFSFIGVSFVIIINIKDFYVTRNS
jgi:MFS family permease